MANSVHSSVTVKAFLHAPPYLPIQGKFALGNTVGDTACCRAEIRNILDQAVQGVVVQGDFLAVKYGRGTTGAHHRATPRHKTRGRICERNRRELQPT